MKLGRLTFSSKHQLIILVLLAIGLNVNTLFHEYVLDDSVVLTDNKYVEKGIKGIPEIVSQSYFKGYAKLENLEFSRGRYRPFALVIFALEYQFFGANPMVSHLINILLFALLIALLYKVLQTYVFREQNKNLAFITCLLFTVHPIHTEVIANVKSRDELITFILLLVSLITFIKHIEKKNLWLLLIGFFCFFLALLTRESAVTFIGVVPLILYFFFNQSIKKSIQFSIPLIAMFVSYLALRFLIVGFNHPVISDIENAPFLYATSSQALATKVFILVKYMWLLIVPHPLSFEYGFNQIPYIEISSIQFIFSLLLLIGLIIYAIYTFKKKSLFSFSILYFIITISLVANFVVDIGTPLSERLLFQPSLAFCIVVAAFYVKANKRFKLFANGILVLILLLFSVKTYLRNAVWENYDTLVLSDVISAPNSIRINQFATNIYLSRSNNERNKELRNEYLKKASYYGERMVKICPNVPDVYINLGYIYYNLFDYNKASELWVKGCKAEPTELIAKNAAEVLSTDLYKLGNDFYEQGKIDDALKCYQNSIELNNKNVEAWYNLGGNYFLKNDTTSGIKAWENVKKLDQNHPLKKEEFYKIKI